LTFPAWKTKKPFITYVVLLLFFISLATYVHGVHRIDPRKLEQSISQSLPPGTDKSKVIDFLNSNHISHSEYLSTYRRIDGNILKSTIGLINGQIHIEFRFDEAGKLVGHELHELFPVL